MRPFRLSAPTDPSRFNNQSQSTQPVQHMTTLLDSLNLNETDEQTHSIISAFQESNNSYTDYICDKIRQIRLDILQKKKEESDDYEYQFQEIRQCIREIVENMQQNSEIMQKRIASDSIKTRRRGYKRKAPLSIPELELFKIPPLPCLCMIAQNIGFTRIQKHEAFLNGRLKCICK